MHKLRDNSGQMTVEFCVVLPILLVIALILVNALSFVSETAKFDRLARNSIRVFATSQARGEETSNAKVFVNDTLSSSFDKENVEVECEMSDVDFGLKKIICRLKWQPTLFGLGIKDEILGVKTPKLSHEVDLVVDKYKLLGMIG